MKGRKIIWESSWLQAACFAIVLRHSSMCCLMTSFHANVASFGKNMISLFSVLRSLIKWCKNSTETIDWLESLNWNQAITLTNHENPNNVMANQNLKQNKTCMLPPSREDKLHKGWSHPVSEPLERRITTRKTVFHVCNTYKKFFAEPTRLPQSSDFQYM